MGWASGFRAGTDMAKNWIDTYEQSRDELYTKQIEDELAAKQEQRGLEVRPDVTQQQLSAAMQPQRGLLPGQQPVAPPQMSPVTGVPPSPAQQLGLQPQQQQIIQASPTAAVIQEAGIGRAPMSDREIAEFRANAYRSKGLMDEAKEYDRDVRILRQEERQIARDAEADQRWAQEFALKQGQDARDADMHVKNLELITGQIEDLGYERNKRTAVAEAYAKFSGRDVVSLYEDKEFNALPADVRDAVMGTMANIEKTKLDATHTYLRNKAESLETFKDVKAYIDGDETLTKGTYYRAEPSEDGKKFELQLMNDDGTPAGETKVWDNESQADEYLRTLMTDKLSATRLYSAQQQRAAELEAANRAALSKGRIDANKFIADMEEMIADPDNMRFGAMTPTELRAERARLYGHLVADGYISQEGYDRLVNMKRDPTGEQKEGIVARLIGSLTGGEAESAPPPPRQDISPAAEAAATGLRGLGTAGGFVVDSLTLPFRYGGRATEAAYDTTADFLGDTAAALTRPRN